MSTNTTLRLGKGLEALIPKTYFASGKTITNIPLDEIIANPFQPRKVFKDDRLSNLVSSVKKYGVLHPILVRRNDNKYELIAGERRFRASKLAKLTTIPAIIKNLTDQESLQIALIENLQREDLNIIEVAKGYKELIEKFNLTHEDIAQLFHKSRTAVTNTLRLLNLPEYIQEGLINEDISTGHARLLIPIQSQELQLLIFNKVVKDNLTVRQLEYLIKNPNEIPSITAKKITSKRTLSIEEKKIIKEIQSSLTKTYNVQVKISGGINTGKISLKYNNKEEFEHIFKLLSS